MTGKHDKLRSLFLTALMVMSVFAMTITFAGSAAASNHAVSVDSAVEYDDGTVEIVFNNSVDAVDVNEVYIDGEPQNVNPSLTPNDPRIEFGAGSDVSPNQNLTVDMTVDTPATTGIDIVEEEITATATLVQENDNENVYVGEPIAIDAQAEGQSVYVNGTEGGATVIDGNTGTNSEVLVLDSSNLDSGSSYFVEIDDDTTNRARISASALDLQVSTDTSIDTDTDVEVDVDAVRGPAGIYGEVLDSDGDDVASVGGSLDGSGEATLNFGNVSDAGNYTVEVTDNETGVTQTTDTIEVGAVGDADIEFTDSVVEEHRGDIATITLDAANTEDGTIVIGSEANGYWLHATVEDDDDDGQIVLDFNTYLAGTDDTDGTGSEIITSEDDVVNFQAEGGSFGAEIDGSGLVNETIDDGQYDMNVSTEVVSSGGDLGDMDTSDVARLNLRERATNNLSSLVAPAGTSFDDADAIHAGMGSNVTETSEIANNDTAIFQLDASGLEGAIQHNSDDAPINFSAEHLNPGMNENAMDLLSGYDPVRINDSANDTYFYVVDLDDSDVDNVNDGGEYNMTVDVYGALDDDTDADVYTEWTNVEEETELDTNDDDVVAVQPSAGQNVTGTTNLAPGTELSVQMEAASDAPSPFLITPDATVNADGTFTATTDEFEGTSMGTNFSVDVLRDNDALVEDADGQVTEAPATDTATETDTDTDTATPDDPGTDTATPDDPGTDTPTPDEPTTTEDTGPGFGIAVGLIALIGAALLAARRQN